MPPFRFSQLQASIQEAATAATATSNIVNNAGGLHTLGSSNNPFQSAYVDELHLALNTLYLGDTPVLGTNQDTIQVKADPNQSINVMTSGTGASSMTSAAGINLTATGASGQVLVQATGIAGRVTFVATQAVDFTSTATTFHGNTTIDGALTSKGLTVNGDLTVTGSNFTTHAETVLIKDNMIEVNYGQGGDGVSGIGLAGLSVNRGDLEVYQMVFNEANDMFQVGKVGQLETLASQPFVTQTALVRSCNLSDITNAVVARSNLGITAGTTDAGGITTGTLAVLRGGTGVTTSTGTGNVVLSAGATLTGTTTVETLAATTSVVCGAHTIKSVPSEFSTLGKTAFICDSSSADAAMLLLGVGGNTGQTTNAVWLTAVKNNYGSGGSMLGSAAVCVPMSVRASEISHYAWSGIVDLTSRASNISLTTSTGTGGHILLNANSNVGIGTTTPTEKLHVVGNILATGNVTAQSDARLKTDVALIDNAMARIGAISGYTYSVKGDDTGHRFLGVLAQEVLAVMPEAVTTPPAGSPDGYLSVAYGNLTALLIEGIKELGASVKDVSERLARLEASSA